MAVSSESREFILEQLRQVLPVQAKSMFGGVGLYSDGVFFALIADDVLYFKVSEANRPDFDSYGSKPFQPFGEQNYTMSYYEVPADVLEDEDLLREWANKAVAVALTSGRKKEPSGRKVARKHRT